MGWTLVKVSSRHIRPLHQQTKNSCDYLHKICTRLRQLAFQYGCGKSHDAQAAPSSETIES